MGSKLGAPSSVHFTSTLNCELNLEPQIEGYQYHNVNFLYINSAPQCGAEQENLPCPPGDAVLNAPHFLGIKTKAVF